MYSRGNYNYDSGETFVIIKHKLQTLIFKDDVITFNLAFTMSGDSSTDIVKDNMMCEV